MLTRLPYFLFTNKGTTSAKRLMQYAHLLVPLLLQKKRYNAHRYVVVALPLPYLLLWLVFEVPRSTICFARGPLFLLVGASGRGRLALEQDSFFLILYKND